MVQENMDKRPGGTKASEQSFQEAEERHRKIIDSIADGYYEVDLEGNFTVASDYIAHLGYPVSDILGMNFSVFTSREEKKKFLSAFHEVFKTGKPFKNKSFTLVTKDGEERRVSVSAALIRDKQGQPTGFRGIFRDITDVFETETLLLEISRTSPIGMYALKEGRFTYVNEVFCQLIGCREEEIIGQKAKEFVHPEDWPRVRQVAVSMLKGEVTTPYEFRLLRKDGQVAWVMESLWSIKLRGEKLAIGNIMDITPLKKAENSLKQSEERYRTIIENMEEGYYESDLNLRLIFFNDSFAAILGYSPEELKSLDLRVITDREKQQEIREKFLRVYETGQSNRSIEWEVTSKGGRRIFTELSATLRRDETGKAMGFRGILRDATERREREQIIKQLAYYDPLTGLPNRRLFDDRFHLALAGASRQGNKIALMVMDLDDFKSVNDSYGHETGDLLLKEIGGLLSKLLRKGDTVARLGGDEFIILLPDILRMSDVKIVARKILAAFKKPFKIGEAKIKMAPSIGITLYPDDAKDKDQLIRQADQAMYLAKRKGGNRYFFFAPNQRQAANPSSTVPPGDSGPPDDPIRDRA